MADQKRWFKVWTSILSDDDFDCSSQEGRDRLARFVWLGAYAALHGEHGKTDIELSFLLSRLGVTELSRLTDALACKNVAFEEDKNRHGKTAVTIDKWNRYQEDTTQAQRQQASRSKKRREEIRGDEIRREEKDDVVDFKFETFWKAYPKDRRVNKKKAYEEWKKEAAHLEEVQRLIMTALPRQIAYKEAMRKQGRFTPEFQDPERWLKNRRWTDEIPDILTREISPTAAWNRPMPKL